MSDRVKFGLWGTGVVLVFLFHLAALLASAVEGGEHSALVWSILLLIAAPVSVVAFIGGSFARSARNGGGDEGEAGSVSRPDS